MFKITALLKTKRLRSLFFLSALFASQAMCNQYKEISFESKVAMADLVVIATVASVSVSECKKSNSCATVDVHDVLKGEIKGETVVLFNGLISEFNPKCCEVGATYLFLLKKNSDGYFESVNGPFGIYKTNPRAAVQQK